MVTETSQYSTSKIEHVFVIEDRNTSSKELFEHHVQYLYCKPMAFIATYVCVIHIQETALSNFALQLTSTEPN